MMSNKLWMLAVILFFGLTMTSCVDSVNDNPSGSEGQSAYLAEPSFFASHIDQCVLPGDDFYQYAVGKWLKVHPLKDGEKLNGPTSEQTAIKNAFLESLPSMSIMGSE